MVEEIKVNLNNEIITVQIIRKNNKNVYFRFDEKNNLIVTTNKRISTSKIIKLINENQKSLIKMLNKNKKRYDESDEVRILGLKYNIKYNDEMEMVKFNDGCVYTKNNVMLDNYINEFRIKIFTEEINKLVNIMNGIPKFTLKIRNMKTRWGVCNYVKKTVTLNSQLIKYDRKIIDYVIIHELCHFIYHNHSKEFWCLVEKYCPNYKDARRELRN